MKRRRKSLNSLTIRENPARSEVVEKTLRWIRDNKRYKIERKGYYPSPRMSSEVMDCSMPLTFDHYSSCSMGCTYCFAYLFNSDNPIITDKRVRPVNVKSMIKALAGEPVSTRGQLLWNRFFSKKFLLHWGGLADPFCYFERTNRAGYPLLEALGDLNYPTLFSFKGSTIFDEDYLKLFQKYSKQKNFAFQVSIVTANDTLAKVVEIGVPSPTRRLKAIKVLSDMGYYVILRLRPFIIGVTDESLSELLSKALECGIGGVSMEFFALDGRATVGVRGRYNWLGNLMGSKDIMRYFSDLSPSERGVSMRLNRLVKEEYVKEVYSFCVRNDLVFACSDPDYKELNTSGSCCGMPDDYPDNPLLENWSRSQLTYHIKEARRKYHKTGEIVDLVFGEVYGPEATYLDDPGFTNDHINVSTMANAVRYAHTYRTIIQRHWNNLRSYSNPFNYFHGKVMPIGLDDEGNITYRYCPMHYEDRWKAQGIDLTK